MMTSVESRLASPITEADHIRGKPEAHVSVVEYGDFECPHCGRAHLVISELRAHLGDRFRFVYRHFPLTTIHPHAESAAESSEAAAHQDRFWEMHDMLFSHQDMLEVPDLIRYGAMLRIDPDWMTRALSTHSFQGQVREDFVSGVRSGVSGTPTFFIDSTRYDGPLELYSLSRAIEVAEARAR